MKLCGTYQNSQEREAFENLFATMCAALKKDLAGDTTIEHICWEIPGVVLGIEKK